MLKFKFNLKYKTHILNMKFLGQLINIIQTKLMVSYRITANIESYKSSFVE